MRSQNSDGGWGYRSGQSSAIEPTCWALLAAGESGLDPINRQRVTSGAQFLKKAQLTDGSWPTVVGGREGAWVTSLASLALGVLQGPCVEVDAGLDWLSKSWPAEGGLWWRLRHRLFAQSHLVRQDHRLRGWSWTPRTSSWVEPTAYALLAIRPSRGWHSTSSCVERRVELARKMLCDRMCAGGGWNCGNPSVYGVAGESLVGPTCWALLALAEFASRPQVQECISQSLAWLERAHSKAQSQGSLALAHLCLKAFRRVPRPIDSRLSDMHNKNHLMQQIPVLAWISLAAQPVPRWIAPAANQKG